MKVCCRAINTNMGNANMGVNMKIALNTKWIPSIKQCLLLLLGSLSFYAMANEKSYSTPTKAAVVVNSSQFKHRVCYYQDHAYSLGALLEIGGYILRCDVANNVESNGALKWVTIAETTQKHPSTTHEP